MLINVCLVTSSKRILKNYFLKTVFEKTIVNYFQEKKNYI